MKYPNVAEGVKKIFVAEVLALIGAIAVVASLAFVTVLVGGEESGGLSAITSDNFEFSLTGSSTNTTLFLVLVSVGGIISLISFIIGLIGTNRASRDEDGDKKNFKYAFLCTIFSLIFSIAGSCLTIVSPAISSGLTAGGEALGVLTIYYVLAGISYFADKAGDAALAKKSKSMMTLVLGTFVASIILEAIMRYASGSLRKAVLMVLIFALIIVTIVQYILYFIVLIKAKKTFSEQ